MARDSEERVKIEVPKGVVVTLAIALMTAIGSPWVAKFSAPGPEVPDIKEAVLSLQQSRDQQEKLNIELVEEVKQMNATLNRMDGRLSAFDRYGWPSSRLPAEAAP